MKRSTAAAEGRSALPVLVTGSSGFIGQHLCAELTGGSINVTGVDRQQPSVPAGFPTLEADIRQMEDVERLRPQVSCDRLVHLAAEAEVIMPWREIPALLQTNLQGTWNVLTAFSPSVCVFPSSSSVYGNSPRNASLEKWNSARPLGLYGVSKSAGEILLRDWSYEQNRVAILLRLANVIGPGCRGLIPYLVRHAKNDPEGLMPAQLRGNGRLVRDYVPVSFVVEIIRIVLERSWTPGNAYIFNVSTGRGLTNRQVAEVVQKVLRREGYRLRFNWDNPVPPGEARSVIENTRGLKEELGMKIPSRSEVEECIRLSVRDHLRSGRA